MIEFIVVIGGAILLTWFFIWEGSRTADKELIHRKKLCGLYGHKNTIDVLATDADGRYYVRCTQCERCLEELPLDAKRTL